METCSGVFFNIIFSNPSATKNHEQHTLPLSDYLCQLLEDRKAATQQQYVFSGAEKGGYIIEPRKQIATGGIRV